MTLVKFNNRSNNALLPGFSDVFDSFFNDNFFSDRMVTRVPAVNISETESNYHVDLAAPGLKNTATILLCAPLPCLKARTKAKSMQLIPTACCASISQNAKKPNRSAGKSRSNKFNS